MKTNSKYLFDEDFAKGGIPTITLAEAENQRAEAEAQAYRNGFTAGKAQAHEEQNQRIATALAVIGDGFDRLTKALDNIETRLETEAVQVAVAVGGKLAPELIAREPFVEISALATECFRNLVKTPHLAVHIGTDIYEVAKSKLEEIAQAHGFDGRLVILPDSTMAAGDCRIEWADGGVVRDEAATLSAINDLVDRYVGARNATVQ